MTTERNTIQNILNEQASPGPATPMQNDKELDYIMSELGINRDDARKFVQDQQAQGNNPSIVARRQARELGQQRFRERVAGEDIFGPDSDYLKTTPQNAVGQGDRAIARVLDAPAGTNPNPRQGAKDVEIGADADELTSNPFFGYGGVGGRTPEEILRNRRNIGVSQREFIDDPNNPGQQIPNPNFGKRILRGPEFSLTKDQQASDNIAIPFIGGEVSPTFRATRDGQGGNLRFIPGLGGVDMTGEGAKREILNLMTGGLLGRLGTRAALRGAIQRGVPGRVPGRTTATRTGDDLATGRGPARTTREIDPVTGKEMPPVTDAGKQFAATATRTGGDATTTTAAAAGRTTAAQSQANRLQAAAERARARAGGKPGATTTADDTAGGAAGGGTTRGGATTTADDTAGAATTTPATRTPGTTPGGVVDDITGSGVGTPGGPVAATTRTGPFGTRTREFFYGADDAAARGARSTRADAPPGAGGATRGAGGAGDDLARGGGGGRGTGRGTGRGRGAGGAGDDLVRGTTRGRGSTLRRVGTGVLAGLGLDQLLRGTGAYDALGTAFDRGRDFLTGFVTGDPNQDPNQDPNATGGGAGGGAGSGDPRGTGSEYDVTQGASTAMALADQEIARVAARNIRRKGYKGQNVPGYPPGINQTTIDRIKRKYANQEAARQRRAGAIPGVQAPPARLGGQEARSTHTPVPIRSDASPEERQRIASHNLRMAARSRNEAEFGTPTPSQQEIAGRSQRIRQNTQAQRDRATAIALGMPIQGPEGQGVLQRVGSELERRYNNALDAAGADEIAGGAPPAGQGGRRGTGTQVDPNAAPPSIANREIPDGRGGTTTTTGAGMAAGTPNTSGTTNSTQGGSTQQGTGTNRTGGGTQQGTTTTTNNTQGGNRQQGTTTTTTSNTQGGNRQQGTGTATTTNNTQTSNEDDEKRRAARVAMIKKNKEEAGKKAEADAAGARQNQGTAQATSGTTS